MNPPVAVIPVDYRRSEERIECVQSRPPVHCMHGARGEPAGDRMDRVCAWLTREKRSAL
jgi:hypothetical protein